MCEFMNYQLVNSSTCKLVNYNSIPLHGIAVAAAFIVFQCVCQGGSVGPKREIIAGIRGQHHGAAHVEAVEIALK